MPRKLRVRSSRATWRRAIAWLMLSVVAASTVLSPLTAQAQFRDPEPVTGQAIQVVTPPEVQPAGLDDDFWSNGGATGCIAPIGAAHLAAFALSLIKDPFGVGAYASLVAFGLNIAVKQCAPVVVPGDTVKFRPDAGSGKPCAVDVNLVKTEGRYSNLLGVPMPSHVIPYFVEGTGQIAYQVYPKVGPGAGWGDVESPFIYHYNTIVDVSLRRPDGSLRTDWPVVEPGPTEFGVGAYPFVWRGASLISDWDKHPFNWLISWYPVSKLSRSEHGLGVIITWVALKVGNIALATKLFEQYPTGAYNDESQYVYVYDTAAPQFGGLQPKVTVEAGIPGGASPNANLAHLRQGFTVTDDCDPTVTVLPQTALFWPVGQESLIRWQAQDSGPAQGGGVNETAAEQRVLVKDTRPPIFAPPMAVVTETASGNLTLPLQGPPVFDFADLNPTVVNNQGGNTTPGGIQFPKGKTFVTWTATDAAGNQSTVQQLVNVKAIGENRTPTANGQTTGLTTRAYEPYTITLSAADPDGDPLWFDIVDHPADGFFIAPLFPYFIEDYRVEKAISNAEIQQLCDDLPTGGTDFLDLQFPYQPDYVAVDDEGKTFVVDRGNIQCRNSTHEQPQMHRRVARFDATGAPIGFNDVDDRIEDIYLDSRTGRVYLTWYNGPGGPGWVNELDGNLNSLTMFRTDYADAPPEDNWIIREPRNAVTGPGGVLYISDQSHLRAYSLELDEDDDPVLLGQIAKVSLGTNSIEDLATDSAGNLYVSDREADRIHKYSPTTINAGGSVTLGQHLGWMGKCDVDLGDGTQVHCDVANHRSIGYSCTDATCGLADAPNPDPATCLPQYIGGKCTAGDDPGQFQEPRGIAIDPNDNLYVTDYANLRVQRFTPEGYYAGQAVSKCGGSCFVLGDFGNPDDITVNSTRFYILDKETNLLHVSETTPIVEKTDTTAKVVYSSDNNFVGTDSFTFRATDGLAKSNVAQVNVNVTRNFRPPFARPGLSFTLPEDTPTPITLAGSDPDVPLDTLTYQISTPPQHGKLTGSGATRTYTPDKDYNGPDSFAFTVSDGRDTSAPEVVTLTITPVADAPSVSAPSGLTAGLGYPALLTAALTDGDLGDTHSLSIDWGDGTIESAAAGQVYLAAEGGPMISDSRNGSGAIYAEHVYKSAPGGPIRICVTDSTANERCADVGASVQPMADVAVLVDHAQDPAIVGRPTTYEVLVAHKAPVAGGGLTATGVVITDRFDPGMELVKAMPSQGSCSFAAPVLTCSLGSLAPDALATIAVDIRPQKALVAGDRWQHAVALKLDQPTPRENDDVIESITFIQPADFVVNALLDGPDASPGDGVCATASGACTLRAAIQEANDKDGGQTIGLGADVYRTDFSEEALVALAAFGVRASSFGPLIVNDDVTIRGLGLYSTTFTGGQVDRPLIVEGGASLTLRYLQLTGGQTDGRGGGLLIRDGDVTLDRVLVNDNRAQDGGGVALEQGSLIVQRSVIANNVVTGTGGGLLIAGGEAELTNVTVGGNQAGGNGGGIANAATLELTHVTFAGNHAATGGGLHNTASATLVNTLLGANTAATGPDCSGTLTLQEANLVQNAAGCTAPGAINGQDPRLYPLDDYGGETLIFAIGSDSPGRDAGGCVVDGDQRGAPRPIGGKCDVGAAEYGAAGDPPPVQRRLLLPVVTRR